MHQDSKRFEILAWGVPISLATMHATSRCDELTCITRPTHPFPRTKRTRLRALLRYLFSPHPCYLLAPNTPPAPGVPGGFILYVLALPGANPSFEPFGGGASRLGQACSKRRGIKPTYLPTFSHIPSFPFSPPIRMTFILLHH